MKSVFIVGNDYYTIKMFKERGWDIEISPWDAKLIQFCGGSDVDPSLYGEPKHPRTFSDPKRDSHESHIFKTSVGDKPMAGICRGGQFLNVMSGGRMWQHTDRHTNSRHRVYYGERSFVECGDHHQMMRPDKDKSITMVTASESTFKETATERVEGMMDDVEAVYYPATKCLCFQPHPEWVEKGEDCQELYFTLLSQYLSL
jgi:gamma-glutamyl-gamma-aminobutyrate hydrolase PuuD